MANYYASNFQSNGSSSAAPTVYYQSIPRASAPGGVLMWQDSFATGGTALTSSDTVYVARVPGGHIPVRLEILTDGDPDTGGTSLAANIGTTADPDLIAAAYVLTDADEFHVFPTNDIDGVAFGNAVFNKAMFTTAAPSSDYNITIVPTANATTATNATFRYRLYYTALASAFDPVDSPAVVAGTQ